MTNISTSRIIKETVIIRMDDGMLLGHLQPLIGELGYTVQEVSSIYVKVPGGGDWSNTNLEINKDSLLFIEIKRETKE